MKSSPVTPELISILENAVGDSYDVIHECESEIDSYADNVKNIVIAQIERRRQLIAVTQDLIIRYKEQ